MFDSLLDSSIDLSEDRDSGVLLDLIFFGPFSRSYAPVFNKTLRMRSLDGFNSINSRNYDITTLTKPLYIYIRCEYSFLRFLGMYICDDCVCNRST